MVKTQGKRDRQAGKNLLASEPESLSPQSRRRGKRTDPHYVAQDILSRRDHSIAEMQQKLKAKRFSAAQIEETIRWLQGHKLLNDEKFAARYVTSTLALKAVGRRWLKFKLRAKGVAQHIIEATLDSLYPPTNEKEMLVRAVASWQRQHPKYKADKPRLQRFLVSRGFSYDSITSAGV